MLDTRAVFRMEIDAKNMLSLHLRFTILNTLELTCIHSCAGDSCLCGSVVVGVVWVDPQRLAGVVVVAVLLE